jgi:hypothetical protein
LKERSCPRCGAAHEPLQEYCLECGLRLPVDRGVRLAARHAWRLELSRYRAGWLWVVLALLALAALGAVAAILASGGGASTVRTIVATESAPTTTSPPATQTPPEPTSRTTTAPPPTETAPRRPRQAAPVKWPRGRSGYTVVLGSVPTTRGREAAVRQARAAIRAGLPAVGVLDSSKFASLRPDYYVIFSGFYRTVDAAVAAVDTAQENGYRRAYEREVTP